MVEYSNSKTINPIKYIKMSHVKDRLICLSRIIAERFEGKTFDYVDFGVGCIDIHIALGDYIEISLWYEYANPDAFEIKIRDFELGLIYTMRLAPINSMDFESIINWIDERLLELKIRRA